MDKRSFFLPEQFQAGTSTDHQSQQLGYDHHHHHHHDQVINNQIIMPATTTSHHHEHQNPHNYSSSSSSLRSLSNIDSPEYSSLLFNNINTTSTSTGTSSHQVPVDQILPHTQLVLQPNNNNINNSPRSVPLQHPISPHHHHHHHQQQAISPFPTIEPHQDHHHHHTMQALALIRNPQFPSPEAEQNTMMKAILAVLTNSPNIDSPLTPSPSSGPRAHIAGNSLINTNASAFKNYGSTRHTILEHHPLGRRKSMFKRSIIFFQRLNLVRDRQALQIPRPNNTTQLHHMMSERKRREKLNESFHALRSLLPPGTKKDKASLLNSTKEYLSSLKAEIEKLSQRNMQLEAQIVPSIIAAINDDNHIGREGGDHDQLVLESQNPSRDHRRVIDVQLRHVSESSASSDHHHHHQQGINVELHVILRSSSSIPIEDLVLSVLEFLKGVENVRVTSLEANTNNYSTTPISRLTLGLRVVVEGSEWNESAFQEAVRRVVANLAQ